MAHVQEIAQHPIESYCCQAESCSDRGKRGAGNLSFRGRGGKNKAIRMVYCRTCDRVFSERKGTPLSGSRLPPEKALAVLKHLREGCGTRATSRLVGVHRDTVTRLARLTGGHAVSLHDEFVAFSPSNQ